MLKNKNFAVSKLLAGIALDATSLSVLSAEGVKFPASGTFRAVLWSQEYDSPIDDAVREIITMELDADDVFTITRAQEGTEAKAWLANDNLAHVLTAGKIDELEAEFDSYLLADGTREAGEIRLTPKASSEGPEGTIFYDSSDGHVWVGTG